MPEPEYTPGTRRVSWSREGQSWSILNEDRHMIANAFESEANARRMAAAPDLLAALERAVWFAETMLPHLEMRTGVTINGQKELLEPMRAAIAKANREPVPPLSPRPPPPERSYDDLDRTGDGGKID